MAESLLVDNEQEELYDDANVGNLPYHSDLYKYSNRTVTCNQEKRIQLFLQKQKEKRRNAFDEKRDLSQLFTEEASEPMDYESQIRPRFSKRNPFGFRLMGSEWFTEIPDDFTDNWLIKLCPEGIRYLVVANKASTTCYYRNGRQAFKFKSKLPGGNSEFAHKFTVLDCVYNESSNTLFVYDVLAWNSVSLLDAEAHMRFCWLKSKFQENPEILEINPNKKFRFSLVDFYPGEKSLLQDLLFAPFVINEGEIPIDGVLFYHREGHYLFGATPLVGWLRSFMIPEVFNIDVHPSHLSNKPEDYESVEQFLFSKKKKKKCGRPSLGEEGEDQGNMEYDTL